MVSASPTPGDGGGPGAGGRRLLPQELGATLTRLRDRAGLSVEQVSAVTRIRGGLIRTMESGDFAPCGGAVYARGHLRSIAVTVGADPQALVDAYDLMAGVPSAPPEAPVLVLPDSTRARTFERPRGRGWLLTMIAATAVVTVVAGAALLQPGAHATPSGPPPAPRTSAPPASSAPTIPVPTGVLADAGVNVLVRVRDSASWVHVVDASGALLFQGTLLAGQSHLFHSAVQLKFVFGYAPAVDLVYDGRDVGTPPGTAGSDVANISFSASGPA